MKMLLGIALAVVLCCVSEGQVPHLGSCPNVTVVENLDVNKVSSSVQCTYYLHVTYHSLRGL